MEWWTPEWWQQVALLIPVSAVISAIVTLFIRYIDKPRTLITLEGQLTTTDEVHPSPEKRDLKFTITNSGDGYARDLTVAGHLCDLAIDRRHEETVTQFRWPQTLPLLAPGETVLCRGKAEEKDWRKVKVVIAWSHAPGRWWSQATRRNLQMKATRLAEVPWLPPGTYEAVELPRLLRRWRRLERHTRRWQDSAPQSRRTSRRTHSQAPHQTAAEQTTENG